MREKLECWRCWSSFLKNGEYWFAESDRWLGRGGTYGKALDQHSCRVRHYWYQILLGLRGDWTPCKYINTQPLNITDQSRKKQRRRIEVAFRTGNPVRARAYTRAYNRTFSADHLDPDAERFL